MSGGVRRPCHADIPTRPRIATATGASCPRVKFMVQSQRDILREAVPSAGAAGVYTAVVQRDGRVWIGWIEEVRGVNSQGRTRKELLENLRSALEEILELNRKDALSAALDDYEEVRIAV